MTRELALIADALFLAASITLSNAGPATEALAQTPPCSPALTTTTLPEQSYAVVNVREFGGMVFLYAPEIVSGRSGSFDPFQLWVVEGVYGRPFLQASGAMDQTAFDRLRKNTNVRARPIGLSRSGQTQSLTVARLAVRLEVTVRPAASGADTVAVRVCRDR